MLLARRAAIVRGVVQGVSFRWYAREEAVGLGLTGWVRNAADGTVRLEVQGTVDGVEAFLAWLHRGPSHARVTEVEVEDRAPHDAESDFRIVH